MPEDPQDPTSKSIAEAVRKPNALTAFFTRRPVFYGSLAMLSVVAGAFGIFVATYLKYSRITDRTLRSGAFNNTSDLYASPVTISEGDAISLDELVSALRQNGYTAAPANRRGHYEVKGNSIRIVPGSDSSVSRQPARIEIANGKITGIFDARDGIPKKEYPLEPQLITNISDRNREKRKIVRFAEIPKMLVNAVVSVEDKRFFHHNGFDAFRILKAAYVDLKQGRKEQGASTLSMQLARSLWLIPDKNWKRKAIELAITMRLEEKLTKEQIFEYYCNQVYLGRRGTYSIHGFGAASAAYFGKDLGQLTLPEAATLAGLIQRPSYFNPLRNLERLKERRNVVLGLMLHNGYITKSEYQTALDSPMQITPGSATSSEAPYFVDLVNDELQNKLKDREFAGEAQRVYTTLDVNLQRAATEAVRIGMQNVDEQLKKLKTAGKKGQAQVALVAIDPHTGEVKALIGGRNYAASQLNRALANRQPGSVFKPFVYAAALNTAITGGPRLLTAATIVVDEPTTFYSGKTAYAPGNFHHASYGEVTLRSAIAKSMNIPTVKVAQMVGYGAVSKLAKRAGLNDVGATPSVALGSYEATPLDIAGAYTIYANQGVYVHPSLISKVTTSTGESIYARAVESHKVLDPRIAYLMVNLMEEVMRSGTAAGVRSRGFTAPAAGKTGTSRDGWFAGFTSQLLCIVWVGFDDNSELNLEGAKSALPIWTEFMKRAVQHKPYKNTRPFPPPSGITSTQIDPETGLLSAPGCPETRTEFFVAGTEPTEQCSRHAFEAVVEVVELPEVIHAVSKPR